VHLDLLPAGEEEDGARLLLSEDLEERWSPEAKKPVYGAGGRDPQLARSANLWLAVDLDQHLAFEDAQDLVGVVVAMEVPDIVGSYGLNPHDESPQAVLGAGDDANGAGSGRERHCLRCGALLDPFTIGTAWLCPGVRVVRLHTVEFSLATSKWSRR
jgi:hypothetical protein